METSGDSFRKPLPVLAVAPQTVGNGLPVSAMASQTPGNRLPVSAPTSQTPRNGLPVLATAPQTPGKGLPVLAMAPQTPGNGLPVLATTSQTVGECGRGTLFPEAPPRQAPPHVPRPRPPRGTEFRATFSFPPLHPPPTLHPAMLPRFFRNPFADDGPSLEELQTFTADHLERLRNYNPPPAPCPLPSALRPPPSEP